jgi:DNA-binding SARP family transcriptional activator/tetratricopeptide (TPR) repeat protein
MVSWRVLGVLEVRTEGTWATAGAPKMRALAATLLAEPGRVVPTGQLIDELWGDEPAPAARRLVAGYVFRLRQLIDDPSGQVLITQAPGYRLAVDPAQVDASRFEELLSAGRRVLADNADQAAGFLREALSLWRGPALADVPRGAAVAAEASRLEELRLSATELLIEADLRCGRADEHIPELRQLTATQPLQERFWQQLMRALASCDRRAEALEAYAHARRVLADQLGTDPGPGLQQLHRRLLAGQAPVSPLHEPSGDALPAAPRQLPGEVRHFTGRESELEMLAGFLEESGSGRAIVISAIAGTAGVGKTALAVHWGHRVISHFPDGQLYVNLRGYDVGPPVSPGDVLAFFLRTLGVAGSDIPASTDERAARYRSLLAGRRMLVLLDNAESAEQVRPLLPAAASCLILVTSRGSLAGLVARDGAQRLELDLLPLGESVALLQALIGERAVADPEATRALAERCARLPLALRIAAERAGARPGTTLASLVAELADEQRRLDVLDTDGDPRTAVRAVFSWSYRQLTQASARAFRLAGLHPGPDLDSHTAAALIGTPVSDADDLLQSLARAHLLQPAQPCRYGMHDLLRAYARELAAGQDRDDDCAPALTRLFDYYLFTSADAMDVLFPARRRPLPQTDSPTSAVMPIDSDTAARLWLDTERPCLVSATRYAAEHGWPGHAVQLAETLFRYLDSGAHYGDAITIHSHARDAAQLTGDRAAQAHALKHLGLTQARQSHYEQARRHLHQSLTLFRDVADVPAEASVFANLGQVGFEEGDYQQAAGHLRRALALYQESGDRNGEARGLANLGLIGIRQGDYERATDDLHRALALFAECGDRRDEALTLANLGEVDLRQGRYEQAIDRLQRSLDVCRQVGDRQVEADALNGLGEAFLAAGCPADARDRHAAAVDAATQVGNNFERARAHNGLGHAYRALGDPGQARDQWHQALALYGDLGAAEAEKILGYLAELR